MKNKDYIRFRLLTLTCLILLSMILLIFSLKLFLSILKMFIYINGLINIFILAVFFIGFIIHVIYNIFRKLNRFNRLNMHSKEILNRAIYSQFKLSLFLLIVNLILMPINYFINK